MFGGARGVRRRRAALGRPAGGGKRWGGRLPGRARQPGRRRLRRGRDALSQSLTAARRRSRCCGRCLSVGLGRCWVALSIAIACRWRRGAAAARSTDARRRSSLLALPYLVFHLLFQDTTYVRYALPLVPAVAFLAVRGTRERRAPRSVADCRRACALGGRHCGAGAGRVRAASRVRPSVRLRPCMQAAPATRPGALGMHQTFRRPLEAEVVAVAPQLASPPRREWLELARYWRDGNTAPLWFLADPRRSDLALIDPRSRADRLGLRLALHVAVRSGRHATAAPCTGIGCPRRGGSLRKAGR